MVGVDQRVVKTPGALQPWGQNGWAIQKIEPGCRIWGIITGNGQSTKWLEHGQQY
jgi:hypothetical protein